MLTPRFVVAAAARPAAALRCCCFRSSSTRSIRSFSRGRGRRTSWPVAATTINNRSHLTVLPSFAPQHRPLSYAADPNHTATPAPAPANSNSNPIPDFDDTEATYASKTKGELLRAAVSFGLCQLQFLVNHAETILNLSRKVLGDTVTDFVLKQTLYGHFCAGEDERRIQAKIQALEQNGIGSILDYAAEDDAGKEQQKDHEIFSSTSAADETAPIGRMYDYRSEGKCDAHAETFRKCIRDVAALQKDGYAAVKVTALGNPKLLERLSRAIVETQNLFAKFDTDGDGLISRDEFEHGFEVFFRDEPSKLRDMMEELNPSVDGVSSKDGSIDYITWSMMLSPKDLSAVTVGCREIGPLTMATPTDEEVGLMEKMYERANNLAQEAAASGTRLLIDAEHYRYQPAIGTLVLDLQRTYNSTDVTDFPIVYNTYQCYLKDSLDRLKTDVERSERFGYHFGTKLVRGAYMESERKLAKEIGYPSPICDTIEDTHLSYDSAVDFLLNHAKRSDKQVELMLATHNEASCANAIGVMNELGVDRRDQTISFAQLYGMKDNLSYNLGRHGYRAYKYVPYGEVKMVVPYLLRRANENSSVAGGASVELSLVLRELSRRLTGRASA